MGGDGGARPREPSRPLRAGLAPDGGVRHGGRGDRLSEAPGAGRRARTATPPRSPCCAPAGCARPSEPPARRSRWAARRPPACRRRGSPRPAWRLRSRPWPMARPASSRPSAGRGRSRTASRRSVRTGSRPIPAASGRTARSRRRSRCASRVAGRSGSRSWFIRVARQAAARDDVADGLAAKFSIPYLVAFSLLHGAPGRGVLRHHRRAGSRTGARVDHSHARRFAGRDGSPNRSRRRDACAHRDRARVARPADGRGAARAQAARARGPSPGRSAGRPGLPQSVVAAAGLARQSL